MELPEARRVQWNIDLARRIRSSDLPLAELGVVERIRFHVGTGQRLASGKHAYGETLAYAQLSLIDAGNKFHGKNLQPASHSHQRDRCGGWTSRASKIVLFTASRFSGLGSPLPNGVKMLMAHELLELRSKLDGVWNGEVPNAMVSFAQRFVIGNFPMCVNVDLAKARERGRGGALWELVSTVGADYLGTVFRSLGPEPETGRPRLADREVKRLRPCLLLGSINWVGWRRCLLA
ncbi:MAG: hypothetical protein J0H49_09165 [Acidobacteria bacterium]|nr:hypothetical protein [Acidobacteriota bacterium]